VLVPPGSRAEAEMQHNSTLRGQTSFKAPVVMKMDEAPKSKKTAQKQLQRSQRMLFNAAARRTDPDRFACMDTCSQLHFYQPDHGTN